MGCHGVFRRLLAKHKVKIGSRPRSVGLHVGRREARRAGDQRVEDDLDITQRLDAWMEITNVLKIQSNNLLLIVLLSRILSVPSFRPRYYKIRS